MQCNLFFFFWTHRWLRNCWRLCQCHGFPIHLGPVYVVRRSHMQRSLRTLSTYPSLSRPSVPWPELPLHSFLTCLLRFSVIIEWGNGAPLGRAMGPHRRMCLPSDEWCRHHNQNQSKQCRYVEDIYMIPGTLYTLFTEVHSVYFAAASALYSSQYDLTLLACPSIHLYHCPSSVVSHHTYIFFSLLLYSLEGRRFIGPLVMATLTPAISCCRRVLSSKQRTL